MILLIASPGRTQTALISFFDEAEISVKVCDDLDSGIESYHRTPSFDLVIIDFRMGAGVGGAVSKLVRNRHPVPVIVVNVPFKSEIEVFRSGATGIFGPGYSPHSLVLLSSNLIKLWEKRLPPAKQAEPRTPRDYSFGTARVSPDQRKLIVAANPGKQPLETRLTKIDLRILGTLKSAPRRTVNYEFLSHTIWRRAYEEGKNGVVREAVSGLRRHFAEVGLDLNRWVKTVHGTGLRYEPD
jgi:DNA-binding response OmpR family regulator